MSHRPGPSVRGQQAIYQPASRRPPADSLAGKAEPSRRGRQRLAFNQLSTPCLGGRTAAGQKTQRGEPVKGPEHQPGSWGLTGSTVEPLTLSKDPLSSKPIVLFKITQTLR